MTGLEEFFNADAYDARRIRDAEKILPVPAPNDEPPFPTLDGSHIVIPSPTSGDDQDAS